MSRPATKVRVQPDREVAVDAEHRREAPAKGETDWGAVLLRTFDGLRDELVSTLWFVLGNQEDAQDIAQEVFLRCWRSRDSLPDVQNLRAWIFRVGLNAAKDMQRSAWHRKAKGFTTDETMIVGRESVPGEHLEDQEDLARLRVAIL